MREDIRSANAIAYYNRGIAYLTKKEAGWYYNGKM